MSSAPVKTPKMPEVGPVGRNVIANVEWIRAERGVSARRLSALLEASGRPIPPLGIARMQQAARRVDVDELVALAEVLGVTPDVLLSPPETVRAARAPVPAVLREARNLVSCVEDLLGVSGDPEASGLAAGYVDRALRRVRVVQIELEELLEQVKASA